MLYPQRRRRKRPQVFRHGDHVHDEVAVARLCAMGHTFPCGDFMEAWGEDGRYVVSCTAARWATERGSECEVGHAYVDMEARARDGWEYVEDTEDARNIERGGREARAFDGTRNFPVAV
jgi:hypothetical protein